MFIASKLTGQGIELLAVCRFLFSECLDPPVAFLNARAEVLSLRPKTRNLSRQLLSLALELFDIDLQ